MNKTKFFLSQKFEEMAQGVETINKDITNFSAEVFAYCQNASRVGAL